MADVADAQHVADDAVAVAVQAFAVGQQIIDDHLALQLSALLGVEADIVGLAVEGQGVHVQLTGGSVGGLAVEPDDGLLVVGFRHRDADDAQDHQNGQSHGQDLPHGYALSF